MHSHLTALVNAVRNRPDGLDAKPTATHPDTSPLTSLLTEVDGAQQSENASFSTLRGVLLEMNPLDAAHIARVNKAEAKYWRLNQGDRVGDPDEILAFDCGGQQLVHEVVFRVKNPGDDVAFVTRLLERIESSEVPAPAPIEQRWTCGSSAAMSPVSSGRSDDLFSWVGVIMYLPESGAVEDARSSIIDAFDDYITVVDPELNTNVHWAKLEPGFQSVDDLKARYPVDDFMSVCNALDPKGILRNEVVRSFFKTV